MDGGDFYIYCGNSLAYMGYSFVDEYCRASTLWSLDGRRTVAKVPVIVGNFEFAI